MLPAPREQRLSIKPESFGEEQRREATALAQINHGWGVRMEVHSSHTEFYADQAVAVGEIEVWSVHEYKGPLMYEGVLGSWDEEWVPPQQRVHPPDKEPEYDWGIYVQLSEEAHGPDAWVVIPVDDEQQARDTAQEGKNIEVVRRPRAEWEVVK